MLKTSTMSEFTILQLRCFDAVVTEGSFQAAAAKLGRTHPTVFTAVKNLERQLGFDLLDRDGYRATLSDAGRAFHGRARVLLHELGVLRDHAAQLAIGEESELRVIIGDLCPLREIFGLLRGFFDHHPSTRLHLHFEAISGPWERLLDGEADLIIHHVDKSDPRLDFIDLCTDDVVPVVAPGLLSFPISDQITPEQMRSYVQLIIRDTALRSRARDYFLIEGARSWTVSDQLMKKELILQRMGWGHMPTFLIAEELRDGRLLSIAGKHLRGGAGELVAARRRDAPHGPVAERLWEYIATQAPSLDAAVGALPSGRRRPPPMGRRPRSRGRARQANP
jgi:DNA-binding transcriptional LysR family regulator